MDAEGIDASALRRLLDIQEITEVIYRYCRGIDRRDYELVRSCYHADAVDDHGDFRGGVDEFLAYVAKGLPAFERTMHFIGNLLVEPEGDRARAESYLVAYHHLRASRTKPERDYLVGLRYVDDFERREASGGSRRGSAPSSGLGSIRSRRAAGPRRRRPQGASPDLRTLSSPPPYDSV